MNFDQAFRNMIGHEGGYVNDPRDPGGETNHGVTKRVAVANGYTGSMKDLPLDTAKATGIASALISCLMTCALMFSMAL